MMTDTQQHQSITPRSNNGLNVKKASNRMRNFHFRYLELCRSKNYTPLQEIKAKNHETSILDFFGDKIRIDDWLLIIESLHYDHTLHHIGVRLRKNFGNVLENLDTDKKARMLKNKPVIFTKFIFTGLIDAVSNSIKCNRNLNTLVLEAVPLNEKFVTSIAKAISTNESLQTISFNRSGIGDKGCETICSTIKYLLHIENVDMSQCQLSFLGATSIADMIKFQKIYRYTEGWKKSLRYRDVNPDSIPGLRRIHMSGNPEIGDKGAELITEILKEDVWIKEIDMSNCGMTDIGGKYVLNCLELNKYIQDFRIKGNTDMSALLVKNIQTQLGKEDERDFEKVRKTKISLPKILERVKLLEEQILMEKNQRKQVENLNEQLHSQIMCYERQLAQKHEINLSDGCVIIEKDTLDRIIKEREDFKNALSTMKITKSRRIAKIRKAKSETKYIENLKYPNTNTQSEHTLKKQNVPTQNKRVFVETTIGDTLSRNEVVHNKNLQVCENGNINYSIEIPVQDKELSPMLPNKVTNFKGVEEALRLFVKKKQIENSSANRQQQQQQVSNVKTLFLGIQESDVN